MPDERLLIIVEDDEGFARTLKRSFERRGYSVLHAEGFETLAAVLGDKVPGYAVVDLKLAGASGLTCVEALHALSADMLIVVFMTRIARNLRDRDNGLAALRQQAAEEDHIVRMGLLASGAAHELGTPLASLSVILSDWRRMPALANDPELMEEIAEMQADVQRCKSIVTGILMSAARSERPSCRRPLSGTLPRYHRYSMAWPDNGRRRA